MNNVIKRDGRVVPFDRNKIIRAVLASMQEGEKDDALADYIASVIEEVNGELAVEKIQDMVEELLMSSNKKNAAKNYILYRDKRSRIRNNNTVLFQEIGKKIAASDVQNQNANIDEKSFGGRRGEAADELLRSYALDNIVSDMARNNHLNNRIYIHDLNSYAVGMHNCLSIPFDDLLKNGFSVRQTDVRPANSINTAFQLLAVIFQIQSLNQFGGCSATHLDWTMVPYVRKSFYKHFMDGVRYIGAGDFIDVDALKEIESGDVPINDQRYCEGTKVYDYAFEMTLKELKQAVEGMYHNLRALGRLNSNIKNIAI